MFGRSIVIGAAIGVGFLAAALLPQAGERIRGMLPFGPVPGPARGIAASPPPANSPAEEVETPSPILLTQAQIDRAGIRVGPVAGGQLARHLRVPGTVIPSANNTARIAVKTTGIVAELRKRLGERVSRGEVVALLDSREIADAKSEYLAARLSVELQKTLFERDRSLWEQRISAEQQFLRSRASYEDLRVKAEAARRKLTFLGLSAAEIDALPKQPEAQFERQEIRSPIDGKIVERRVDVGAAVGRDNLETELYSVVNLAQVWVDLAVTASDLPLVREGQPVRVRVEATGDEASGRIIFIGPVLDQNTRSARVVAELPNPDERWRPGSFVSADIEVMDETVGVLIPAEAIQTISGKATVFVRGEDGFTTRRVTPGRTDGRAVEITAGLAPGEIVAVANSFILKAELGKAAAEE